jgi:hypothetical protein
MAPRKTWIWIVVGSLVAGVLALIAVAGAGLYFVSKHIHTEPTTSGAALRAFDDVAARFSGRRPLYELDSAEQPHLAQPLEDLPTAGAAPDALRILAWDPEEQRLVRVSLPLWMLHVGHAKMALAGDDVFDLGRLQLDGNELRRIGPALVFDFRSRDGVRVLLWTQ